MAHHHLLISATFGVSVVNARSDEQTPDLHDCLPMGEVRRHNGETPPLLTRLERPPESLPRELTLQCGLTPGPTWLHLRLILDHSGLAPVFSRPTPRK